MGPSSINKGMPVPNYPFWQYIHPRQLINTDNWIKNKLASSGFGVHIYILLLLLNLMYVFDLWVVWISRLASPCHDRGYESYPIYIDQGLLGYPASVSSKTIYAGANY